MARAGVYILWAAAIVIFAVLEGVTVQLVSVWFVLGAIAALIAAFCGAGFYVQIILFAAVSLAALAATRPLVKKFVQPKVRRLNANRCIGATGVVTQRIDNLAATGQIKVNGSIWTARSASGEVIESGQTATVERIEGVKVIVHSARKE